MIRSTIALFALVLSVTTVNAESIILSCDGQLFDWWERDKGGEMKKARVRNVVVKFDDASRTVRFGDKSFATNMMGEDFISAVHEEGDRFVNITIDRLSGKVVHRIMVDGALMQIMELACNKVNPKF